MSSSDWSVDDLVFEEEIPDVDSIEDLFDAFDICEKYGVPIDGLTDVEDCIERLKLHFNKYKQKISRKKQIEKSLLKSDSADRKRREKVVSVMQELLDIVNHQGSDEKPDRNSRLINVLLRQDGTTDNLAKDCAERIADLSSKEIKIIVAGETSAGKSSLLNLLLGSEILPTHNNSCTSVITVIKYAQRRYCRILYKTGDIESQEFELNAEGHQRLKDIAFMKSPDEREYHNIKEVHIYLPLPLLECGLVLIDTPGIGENEFLETELINFIGNTQIHGFMYIIKTDNAGGVQEDRLLSLLKIIVQKQRSGSSMSRGADCVSCKFNPRAALFVCNRFDMIDKNETDKVKQNAISKLRDCWPDFIESQIIFFSTEKAVRDVNADEDYINDNYKEFLESLEDLIVLAREKRLKRIYQWIENVLKRTIHYLRATVHRLDLSDKELNEKTQDVRKKLDKLQQKSEQVISSLYTLITSQSVGLQMELKEHIKSPACRFKLTKDWREDEIPKVSSGLGGWPWIKQKVHEVFYDKLIACVDRWDEDERKINQIEESISIQVKTDLLFLEAELKEIENKINGENSLDSSENYSQMSRSRRRSTLTGESYIKSRFLITSPKLPLKLAGRILKPLTSIVTTFKNARKEQEFKKDPVRIAQELANEFYQALVTSDDGEGGFKIFVDYLLERPNEYLCALERKIPYMIMGNQVLLWTCLESLDEERQHQVQYENMMTKTEHLRRSLVEFGEGQMFVNDFSKNEIQIQRFSDKGISKSVAFKVSDFIRTSSDELESNRRRDFRGIWTVIYSGELVRDSMEKPVAIKVYLPSSGVATTYKEVAKLRCLTNANMCVAEFLGIHDAEMATPAFVYAGSLRSVRRFLNGFCSKRECVPEILEDTASALEYLHKKGLVHMELTQDTLTVDDAGRVQISGACLPRHAKLPDTTSRLVQAGDFVYLAPEVLRGEEYSSCADIYSFGLLILELAHCDVSSVFQEQRQMLLGDFVRNVNTETMLNLSETVEIFTIKTRALICNCLEMNKNDRPEMAEVVEYANYIKGEEDAMGKLRTRRSRPVIKRNFPLTKL